MKAGYEELQKSYDLFSMMESVDKQLEVIETERMFITKAIEGKVLNTDVITQHEFMSRFPAINSKIKEANEGMEDALNEAKQHYDKYKSLVMKVKNDYFSRNAEDLQRDMQQLAPRVAYLAQIVQDVIQSFGVQNEVVIFWIFQIMNILHYAFLLTKMAHLRVSLKRIVNILKKS